MRGLRTVESVLCSPLRPDNDEAVAPMRRLWMVLLLVLASWPLPAAARGIRSTSLDSIDKTHSVFIGTIVSKRVVAASQSGPFGSRVKVVELGVLVDIPFRNAKTGDDVTVRHVEVLPSSQPSINGFSPVKLEKGKAYLLFLQPSTKASKQLELVSVEDSSRLVELSPTALPPLVVVSRRATKPLDKAIDVLLTVIDGCKDRCNAAIWLLASSPAFKAETRNKSARSKRFTAALQRVTQRSKDHNTLLAAFTELGRRGQKAIIPRIVRLACPAPGTKVPKDNSNVVSFLQGLDDRDEIRALDQILACSKDQATQMHARYRRDHLTK
jgi:hypothetical protein